ncbi:MAG: SDR family NAD(P)-dependent oxidoreductase [Eubacteriales bacterium]|nr:SDR family NAD(P)-dependent oxidoreductase [Eubacteriales bacterium]MDD3881507.1 SDR family NAD(P)-dependent oxidoreductase [Eubacteriales bacterium]MDD4513011.1 SDR family NAD(P)-dependent oxidoreductase [Eubacteriales bacterium]
MADLTGKTTLVTGANSGMGMAIVAAFADMGAHVVCAAAKLAEEPLLMRLSARKTEASN